jgi:hypothetical protein
VLLLELPLLSRPSGPSPLVERREEKEEEGAVAVDPLSATLSKKLTAVRMRESLGGSCSWLFQSSPPAGAAGAAWDAMLLAVWRRERRVVPFSLRGCVSSSSRLALCV